MSMHTLNVTILPQGRRDFQTHFIGTTKAKQMLKNALRANGKLSSELPVAF